MALKFLTALEFLQLFSIPELPEAVPCLEIWNPQRFLGVVPHKSEQPPEFDDRNSELYNKYNDNKASERLADILGL